MNKKYRDEIAKVTHDMMKDFQQVGAVSDAEMREFEKNCFVPHTKTVRKSPELHEHERKLPAGAAVP